jgi:hypothetical protein
MKSIFFGKNKKGSLSDTIFGGAYLLKTAVVILLMVFIWITFQSIMADTVAGTSGESTIDSVMDVLTNAYYSMDYLFPLIVGGLLIISTLFAFKTGANIIYGIISFILWIIAMILSVVFVNVYIVVSSEFPTIYAAMPVMDFIMSNLHFFTLGWLAIVTIVMFRKNNREDNGSNETGLEARFYG